MFGGATWRSRATLIGALALVVAIVAGYFVVDRDSSPASEVTGSLSPTARPEPRVAPSAGGPSPTALNDREFLDPEATVFGGLLAPLLPPGFELVFASDELRPIAVALNANGDRFEATINSTSDAVATAAETKEEDLVDAPEGTLVVGPDGESHDNASLITNDAVITARYVRLDERTAIGERTAVDMARAIARDVPPALITGRGMSLGTGFARDVEAAVGSIIETTQPTQIRVLRSDVFTVEAVGEYSGVDGAAPDSVSIRLETFANQLAPSFLSDYADASLDRRTRRSHRIGTLLIISTIESNGLATSETLEREVLDAIVDILSG